MGIVRKFTAALGSMLALILFVAAIGFAAVHMLEQKAGEIVANSMRMQRLALEIDSRLQLARQAERDFALRLSDLGVEGARSIYAAEFTERINEARRNVAWLQDMERFHEASDASAKSAIRLAELSASLDRYTHSFQQLVTQAAQTGITDWSYQRKIGEMDSEYLQLTSQVRQLAIAASDAAREAHDAISQSTLLVEILMVASVLFALLLAASIIWVLNRTVAKNAIRLNNAATELSLGNLEARADVDGQDEFAQLAGTINFMAERITTLINDLEKQAATASERLVNAIDSISEGFMLYDRSGHLILANRKIMELAGKNVGTLKLGSTVEEVLRANAVSGVFINAIGREEEWVAEKLRQNETPDLCVEEPIFDGRWMQLKPYQTGNGEIVVIMSDITERKKRDMHLTNANSDLEDLVRERTKVLVEKAQELKQANERLMELDELKSAFLSSVSHELRTPLTSLLGFSKIIKRDFSKVFMPLAEDDTSTRLGTRIQSNLDIIGSEGERLTRLINDVLDLSRIESGREDWRNVEVDMAGAVHRAVDSASGLFSPKPEVKLTIRRLGAVPPVLCDPDRLHQVLINLLNNAAKFTQHGEVAIDLYSDEHGQVRLTVEDTGKGIAPRFIEQIFDKFQQAQQGNTLTEKPSGTGLGLAICRQIIEHSGGQIWAESQQGQGTRMCISLPAVEADRPLVLVVDDDPAVCDFLSVILKSARYKVRTANSGTEALELAAVYSPALITMDILMPGMDGRTTIRKLRENSALASIPVLVVSVAADCHCAGGDAALLKPIDRDGFLETVHGLLGNATSNRTMLALECPDTGLDQTVATPYSDDVIGCSEPELWERIGQGFRGTVMVPEKLARGIDLSRLCAADSVQVLLVPEAHPGTIN